MGLWDAVSEFFEATGPILGPDDKLQKQLEANSEKKRLDEELESKMKTINSLPESTRSWQDIESKSQELNNGSNISLKKQVIDKNKQLPDELMKELKVEIKQRSSIIKGAKNVEKEWKDIAPKVGSPLRQGDYASRANIIRDLSGHGKNINFREGDDKAIADVIKNLSEKDRGPSDNLENKVATSITPELIPENQVINNPTKSLEESVEPIALSGRELLNDLLQDFKAVTTAESSFSKDQFKKDITKRFIKTINSAVTGFGGYAENEEQKSTTPTLSELSVEDSKKLNDLISAATEKLSEELEKQATPGMLWNYENSLDSSAKKRYVLNIVGHVYDAIGSMCHTIGKAVGLSHPTAAELFAEAGKFAQKRHEELSIDQTKRISDNKEKGRDNPKNVDLYDLINKNKQDPRSVEDIKAEVKNHDAKVAKEHFAKLVGQVGAKEALTALKKGIESQPSSDPAKEAMYTAFNQLHSDLKNQDNSPELRESNVYLAIANLETALFPNDLIIERKVHPIKADLKEASTALQELEKAINKNGSDTQKESFKFFKAEFNKHAPEKTWAQRIEVTKSTGREKG
jgi:hypothetical protein